MIELSRISKMLLIITGGLLISVASIAEENSLERAWILDGLSTPESVIYDDKSGSLYISNINGAPAEKDGNGFISKVSLQGEILEMQWATGMHAPKGLAISGNHLYVADIDELVEIELATGNISNRYPDPEALFFNDAVAGEDGSVYVSDSQTNTIHRLKNGEFSRWLSSPDLLSPNGLLVEEERMLVTAWGTGACGFHG